MFGEIKEDIVIHIKEPVLSYRIVKVDADTRKVSKPEDVLQYIRNLFTLGIEHFVALYLDSKNRIRHTKVLEEGTVNQANPIVREIFRYGILVDAASVIVAHNHPSGDPEPSREDKEFTRTLVKGGDVLNLKVLDHIIVGTEETGNERYYSFADHSGMES